MNDIVTGTDALRAAVAARATKTNFAPLARDLGISSEALHGFPTGQTSLPPDVLKALASQLWGGHVEFTEPKTITPPPPIDPELLPDRWQPWKTSGLVMPEQLRPRRRRRAPGGWRSAEHSWRWPFDGGGQAGAADRTDYSLFSCLQLRGQ